MFWKYASAFVVVQYCGTSALAHSTPVPVQEMPYAASLCVATGAGYTQLQTARRPPRKRDRNLCGRWCRNRFWKICQHRWGDRQEHLQEHVPFAFARWVLDGEYPLLLHTAQVGAHRCVERERERARGLCQDDNVQRDQEGTSTTLCDDHRAARLGRLFSFVLACWRVLRLWENRQKWSFGFPRVNRVCAIKRAGRTEDVIRTCTWKICGKEINGG